MQRILICLLFPALVFLSCQKEKTETPINVIRVYKDNSLLMEHYYDERYQVIKSIYYSEGDTDYYFYSNYLLFDSTTSIIHRSIPSQSADTIKYSKGWGMKMLKSANYSAYLDSSNYPTNIYYNDVMDGFDCSYYFEFDADGNIRHRRCYFSGGSHNSDYKYTGIANPLRKLKLIPWQLGTEESLVLSAYMPSEISISGYNSNCETPPCTDPSYSGKLSYQISINAKGLPVTVIETNNAGDEATTYRYEYMSE